MSHPVLPYTALKVCKGNHQDHYLRGLLTDNCDRTYTEAAPKKVWQTYEDRESHPGQYYLGYPLKVLAMVWSSAMSPRSLCLLLCLWLCLRGSSCNVRCKENNNYKVGSALHSDGSVRLKGVVGSPKPHPKGQGMSSRQTSPDTHVEPLVASLVHTCACS